MAVENVNKVIAKELVGKNLVSQSKIDELLIKLDGTANKSELGANAILSVSLAYARAKAASSQTELYLYLAEEFGFDSKKMSLPIPAFNIFNGGKHADTNLDFQEFMIVPVLEASFSEKVRAGAEIFHKLGEVLKRAGFDTDVGNEGGYAPDIFSSMQAIELIMAAIIEAGYKPEDEICLGIDVGSSELYNPETGSYIFKLDQGHFTNDTLIGLYNEWFRKYPIISIEDGLAQDDWEGWSRLTKELGNEIMLVGDDLFVTNTNRLRQGIKSRAANAVLIKPNQVGTLTETMECVKLAQKHNYRIMVSHRSGETCDSFISDLAVAIGAEFIKAGSLSRSERLAKYNRLMEIENNLIS